MKKFNRDLPSLLSTIRELQEVKKTPFELNFILMEIEKFIRDHAENYSKRVQILQKEVQALMVEYCKKDADGNPVFIYATSKNENGEIIYTQESYAGLGHNKEYDKRIDVIQKKVDELVAEEIEIPQLDEIKKISRGALAKVEWCGRYEKHLNCFIE